ncbi:ankyrin repeat domain-containing protein [Plantactinospora soyae]|uniref:Ankyrin repeat protein n=1 Tax=Plantactinospora soyae TaxID=1544732 RepID=A0A927R9Q5_9ACTN|nr:ankyrin repeat domain-containing protein [Plantactinospora soyae]MBE1490021.1 ankyrin repeat protein [Plantactinospora soyae]
MDHHQDQRLVAAVAAGDEAAVAQALAAGADPDASAGQLRGSVLSEAAGSGRSGVVRMLLEAGAQLRTVRPHTPSALRAAVVGGHPDVVRELLAHGALAAQPGSTPSALTEAISQTSFQPGPATLQTLRLLLAAGATPGTTEEAPLISAIRRSASPVVLRILLEHGAPVDQRRSDDTPAVVLATRRGDHAAVDVLLQAGADPDARDPRGRTALMHAVERDERRVVAALLLAGAATDAVSPDGMTALLLAQGWQRQTVQFMLGERRVGLDNVQINRTAVELVPTGLRIAGDPQLFRLLASAIDIALDDLGEPEWQARTGRDPEVARAFAQRLRDDVVPAASGSWHELDATVDEFRSARSALAEIAYGTTPVTPDGSSRADIVDLLQELDRQPG